MSPVGVDQLRKAGVNVDLQTMDFPTLVRRRESKERPDKGGWNIYFNIIDDLFNLNPAMNSNIRADGPAQEGRLSFFHGILRSPRNPPEAKSRHGPAVRPRPAHRRQIHPRGHARPVAATEAFAPCRRVQARTGSLRPRHVRGS